MDKMLAGDVLSLARLISIIERGNSQVLEIMKLVYAHPGNGYSVGITGPAGAGKSTILKAVSGLVPLTKGEINFNEKRIDGLVTHEIVNLGHSADATY